RLSLGDDAARPVRRAPARARKRRARPRLRGAGAVGGPRRVPTPRPLHRARADEGLSPAERKRTLPRMPRRIGLVTGNDAAAKRDVLASITARFPPARIPAAENLAQGPSARPAWVEAL